MNDENRIEIQKLKCTSVSFTSSAKEHYWRSATLMQNMHTTVMRNFIFQRFFFIYSKNWQKDIAFTVALFSRMAVIKRDMAHWDYEHQQPKTKKMNTEDWTQSASIYFIKKYYVCKKRFHSVCRSFKYNWLLTFAVLLLQLALICACTCL